MTMYQGATAPAPGNTKWQCSQCGREITGRRSSKRSQVFPYNASIPGGDAVQSQCAACGYTMCSQCLEFQKPSEMMPDREALCPGCGKPFGDGPVLVGEAHPSYGNVAHRDQGVSVEAATFNYINDLHNWAVWILIWSVINTGSEIYFLHEEAQGLAPGEFLVPSGLGCVIMFIDFAVFISSIICLVKRPPWPGFYFVFGIYLIEIGLMNMSAGDFWFAVGIFQIGIAVTLFINFGKYRAAHRRAVDNY